MRFSLIILGGAAWTLLLIGAGNARAEPIQWSYSWSRSPVQVHADSPGTGYISLTDGGLKSAAGSTALVPTNLQAHSTAPVSAPDVFTNKTYALSLFLQDKDSGKSGTMTFTGAFNGTLTAHSSNITNTFTGSITQSLTLGDHLYTVTISSYGAFGPTGASNSGSIAARADVTVSNGGTVSNIFHTPEPSSGVLSLLGTACLGFARSRRRARV
jgi:hypothetical protein